MIVRSPIAGWQILMLTAMYDWIRYEHALDGGCSQARAVVAAARWFQSCENVLQAQGARESWSPKQ
jgi:hypothetical protein